MGLNTWVDVDPKAERISVYYEGTNTVYEGMLVHYNHDTTTNWSGVSRADQSLSDTTAEGSQNEGKWIRVEEPSNANRRFPAGVVAKGSPGIGAAGPSVLEIYVMNGAIVPVYTDLSVAINEAAYMEPGQNTVVNVDLSGEQIGYFMETIDRSGTPGLALACLVGVDQSQVAASSTLGIGLSPLLWKDAPKDSGDPGLGVQYFNDFMDGASTEQGVGGWIVTQSNSTGVLESEVDAAGGVIEVDSLGATADDSVNVQLPSCAVLPAAGVNIWFEARIKIEQDEQQWFFGLAGADTSLMAAGALDAVVDKVGFYHGEADTDLKASTVTARTSASDTTADILTIADDTWTTVGVKITGLTSVEFYQDGVLIETGVTAANIPNAGIALSAFAGYESAHETVSIDWVKLVSSAGRDA